MYIYTYTHHSLSALFPAANAVVVAMVAGRRHKTNSAK